MKKYGTVGHYFPSCANKETNDHYSQSRCANKNPRATIRRTALPKVRPIKNQLKIRRILPAMFANKYSPN